jgi:hypothetical protein
MTSATFPIIPLRPYNYDPKLAGYGQDRLGSYDSGAREMWEYEGRIRGANVLYGICKWQDSRERAWSADCGLVWWTMYDFCGGAVVSSAFTNIRMGVTPCYVVGPMQKRGPVLAPDAIPDLVELTGIKDPTERQVTEILQDSLLAGLITDLVRHGRCGAVVGDRIRRGTAFTAEILLRAKPDIPVKYFSHLRHNTYSRATPPHLMQTKVRVHQTPSYLNRNSGNQVQFTAIDFDSHAGFLVKDQEEALTLPAPVWEKLCSSEYLAMCPQGLFHN